MNRDLTPASRELLAEQCSIISRKQCASSGVVLDSIRSHLRSGRWQTMQRGVYATFTGALSREAQLWAALLRVDPERDGAVFSHYTAAELYGLLSGPSSLIHITVPCEVNPIRHGKVPGLAVHRCRDIERMRHPSLLPPRTRIEETILDLVEVAETFEKRFHWICQALNDRRTTPARLLDALDRRKRFPFREETRLLLGDTGDGVRSWLEMLYVRGVERPHSLPKADRQVRTRHGDKNIYLDNLYRDHLVCVELDGTAAHSGSQQLRDKRRDRRNAADSGLLTLRFGYPDLRTQGGRCAAAAEVAGVLRDRGAYAGTSCGRPGCSV